MELGPKADMCDANTDVRFVPIADILLAEDQTRVCTAMIFRSKNYSQKDPDSSQGASGKALSGIFK